MEKIKNFFRPRRKSMKTVDKLSQAERQKYKNLIPSLFGEFIEEVPLEKKRSNSLNKNNYNLTLDSNPFNYSISGELIKKKLTNQNKPNFRTSLQRNYFIGSLQKRSKLLTSKNVRKGSFEDKKGGNKKEGIGRVITLQSGNLENDNPNFFQRSLKKKKTIDPQDTVTAEHLSFKITEKEIKETKEKLEEYQEKMRKTQLRYYVFKKITNFKSTLRMAFHKYRSIVQLMEALDEKKDEIKETMMEKEGENDIELLKKRINILKNVLKNRSFREQKELNKYFIKFYYNSKFAVKMENLNKNSSNNATSNTSTAAENNSNNINTNNDNFLDVLGNEIKKEEKKELTPEEIEKEKRKRNKELRDLFYNKVRERQKWLHDHFVKFYYKGLLWAMKTGNIKNNTSSPSSKDTSNTSTNAANNTSNVNNENATQSTTTTTNDQPAEINLDNKTSSEIDIININKEIEKKEVEKKEEEKKDENNDQKAKVRNLRDRSKGLRRLLSERNKEKTNLLRKYFFKFLSNGILLSLKKTTLRSTKSLIEVDIEGNENKSEEKKEEKEESNWIIEEKKRRKQEEEQRERELKEKINQKLVVIFNKKDQIICSRLRSCLQRWNLRAKIMGISDLTGGVRKSKRAKGKKKNKKKEDKKDEEKKEENNENNENK